MARQQFFVTATGTNIGKTFITSKILEYARIQGNRCMGIKPIISGFEMAHVETSDTGILLKALSLPLENTEINRLSPWRYRAPLSPDLAAAKEGETIDFNDLVDYCFQLIEQPHDLLLIEGVGGLMVPLSQNYTGLDWIDALTIPVLLVAGSYLGSISHTLTTLEVLKARRIKVAALIVNETKGSQVFMDDILDSLKHHVHGVPTFAIKRNEPLQNQDSFHALIKLVLPDFIPSKQLDFEVDAKWQTPECTEVQEDCEP